MNAELVQERSKMMGVRQLLFTLALGTFGLSLSPDAAWAIGFSTLSSEAELNTLLNQPAFIGQGQFGSVGLTNSDNTESNVDFVWSKGEQQPFSLSYDGSTVRYSVGEKTLETKNEGFVKDIFIYTKATEYSTSVLLNNLLLTDSSTSLSISGIGASYPNNKVNIFWIKNIEESFTLTGNALLNWQNQLQNPANLFYQIQVGNVGSPTTSPNTEPDEPEPTNSPNPEPQDNTETDWFPWFPKPEPNRHCSSGGGLYVSHQLRNA